MRYLAMALLMGAIAVPANALVIDFNGEGDQYGSPITSDGFDFNFAASGWGLVNGDFGCCSGQNSSNGTSRIMFSGGTPGRVTMTRQGGGTFSLTGVDIATAFLQTQGRLNITGIRADASEVLASFSIDDTYDSVGLSGFSNLVSVVFAEGSNTSFTDYGVGIDNLVIDQAVVPEPATWAMLIAGFGMAGVAARRRTRTVVAYN